MNFLNEYVNELSDLITSEHDNPYRINVNYIKKIDRLNINEDDLNNLTKESAIDIIDKSNTISFYTAVNTIRALKEYIKWCISKGYITNSAALSVWDNLPLKEILSQKLSQSNKSQYINYNTFKDTYFAIQRSEPYNELFYRTLFRTIYEGVFEGYEAIYNLTTNDIDVDNQKIHINTNDKSYTVQVSKQLIDDLISLSKINYWETNSKTGTCRKVSLNSKSPDNIFKAGSNFDSQFFFKKLRRICDNYFGYRISAKNIFKSGLVYRMNERAKQENINFKDIIDGKDRKHKYIITDELNKFGLEKSYNEFVRFMKIYISEI